MHSKLFLPDALQLTAIVSLAIAPFISGTPSPSQASQPGLQSRDPTLPDGWVDFGCYSDNSSQHTLTSLIYMDVDLDMMTVEFCTNYCNDNQKALAGLEDGHNCYCGNTMTNGSMKNPDSDCLTPCTGNPDEYCGGADSLSVYWNGQTLQPSPTMPPYANFWTLMGCFQDSNDARTLKQPMNLTNQWDNDAESCVQLCGSEGYSLAGMEFGVECWCDNTINFDRQPIDPKYCMLACPGYSSEICGGPNAITIYAEILP